MKSDDNSIMTGRIAVAGVGGGGCNALDSMARHWEGGPALIAINTDGQALRSGRVANRIQIGERITRSMGTGGDAKVGKLAAEDDFDRLQDVFRGMDLVFVVTTLGGGTGTGAAPVVARAARETGAMVITFATLPFAFEGDRRMSQARQGQIELQDQSDVVIVIPNQSLFAAAGPTATAEEAFEQADYYLSMGAFAIWKLLTQRGIINLDFATLRMVARCSGGGGIFSYGEGKGANRATEAAQGALHSPLLEDGQTLADAESILVSILGGQDLTVRDVQSIMTAIEGATRKDAHIHMGTAIDDAWQDTVSVTIVASRFWRGEDESDAQDGEPTIVTDPDSPEGKKKRKKSDAIQTQLGLEEISKGIFKDIEPTLVGGEDLDVPTFLRRRVQIDK